MKPGMSNSVKKEKPETGASCIGGLGKMSLKQPQKQKFQTRKLHDQRSSSSESSDSDRLEEYLKFYIPNNSSYEMKFQDWLFGGCEKDVKRDILKSISEQAEKLGIQGNDRREWAKKTVINVINEISDSGTFLQKLIRSSNNILEVEEENLLKSEKDRREVPAASSDTRVSKTQKSIVDSKKEEKKIVRKDKDGEEKDFLGKFEGQKLEVENLARRLEKLEVSLRKIKEEKEQNNASLMEAERRYAIEKENSKREMEMKIEQAMDEVKMLNQVISQIRDKVYSLQSTL